MDVRHWCGSCARYLEPGELKMVRAGSGGLVVCGLCGAPTSRELSRVKRDFGVELVSSLRFPFNPTMFAISAVVFVASVLVSFGFNALMLTIQLGWAFEILRSTADDREAEIDIADRNLAKREGGIFGSLFKTRDVEFRVLDWFRPFLRYVVTFVVALTPSVVVRVALGNRYDVLAQVLAFVGMLYVPAGLVVAAHNESVTSALWPVPAFRLIARVPAAYATTCAFLAFVLGLGGGVQRFAAEGPWFMQIIGGFVGFLTLVIAARALGILVREHREEIG